MCNPYCVLATSVNIISLNLNSLEEEVATEEVATAIRNRTTFLSQTIPCLRRRLTWTMEMRKNGRRVVVSTIWDTGNGEYYHKLKIFEFCFFKTSL